MTRKSITTLSIALLIIGLVLGGVLGTAACTREVIKEVPMTLPTLAEKIKNGEIDVGTEYGLALGQRYHNIHATVLGLECTTCHMGEMTTQQEVFSAQDVSPQAPGPVDRRGCLGCHRAGPGSNIYGSSSP
jgi:hypothetical protein